MYDIHAAANTHVLLCLLWVSESYNNVFFLKLKKNVYI